MYDRILNCPLPPEVQLRYLAYTFHLFGDSLQFSVISRLENGSLQGRIDSLLDSMPGVLHKTVYEIEKTYPFISPDEWRDYARRHALSLEWDEKNMLSQFQK